ncbi:MAG: hypothetical protein MUC95_10990, partial [Spirochaetes bacterium]|nr:hypothetical protein [Spirochaetota bacterium]
MSNKIKISRLDENTLKITFSYDPEIIKIIKTIRGNWWNKDGRFWSVPNSDENINMLIDLYGDPGVDIDPDLGYFKDSQFIAALPDL